jgi:hypothetical protein
MACGTSPRQALLVSTTDSPFWCFGCGPFADGTFRTMRNLTEMYVLPPDRILRQLPVPALLRTLGYEQPIWYLDRHGVGRLATLYDVDKKGALVLTTQCGTTVAASLHFVRIPTSLHLRQLPAIFMDAKVPRTEILYRFSFGPAAIYSQDHIDQITCEGSL